MRYELWQQDGGDGTFTFTELYISDAAMMDHAGSTHVSAFGQLARSLAAGVSSIAIYREVAPTLKTPCARHSEQQLPV